MPSCGNRRSVLAAVDIVDLLRAQLHDPEGLRDDLLEIRSMAHSILSGVPMVSSRRDVPSPSRC